MSDDPVHHVSIILPAHDEATYIGACLGALLDSTALPSGWQVALIVVANGCRDDTATIAHGFEPVAQARGWALQVIDVAQGGKLNALNLGEAAAQNGSYIYLDADVVVDPDLIGQLSQALDTDTPRYASGQPRIAPAQSRTTAHYARFWTTLPFVSHGVPGFGVFAMNAAGRARWERWPDIISDDTFARLNFTPAERIAAPAGYKWPMVEGFARLVQVRRRQNDGVDEIAARFPELMVNDDKASVSLGGALKRLIRDPVGFCTYAAVSLAVKTPLFRTGNKWARGR